MWRPTEGGRLWRRQVVRLGPAQVSTCEVGSRPVPGGGSRLSLEKARTQRVAGGCPPPPFYSPARSHSLVLAFVPHCPGGGAITVPCTCPDLETFFHKMLFQSIFFRKMRPKSVLGYRRNSPPPDQTTIPKTSERQQAGHKNRGSRACPRPSSPISRGRITPGKCNSRRKRPTGRQQSGRIRESIKTYHRRRPSCELPPS